ncbi:helix-turn-helix domain-containing protein [Lentibacter algarum]|uniref:GlxA family transcriptional regulator n=1 Tax=Lentibacter algarum TaxID=576131 RepID=UPI001C09AA81|nr:helix-turn-helix domain-containing protein [Lentibacter algarum]MBU2983296.1 helix-turn-helix domain-containing protein [Lentibacter algarum]
MKSVGLWWVAPSSSLTANNIPRFDTFMMHAHSQEKQELSGHNFPAELSFEIYVQSGFSDFEVSAITHTLEVINHVVGETRCKWSFVSNTPGFVTGAGGQIVRAAPVIPDHNLSDHMIVVGGLNHHPQDWLPRLRSMDRVGRTVALLSSAATAYIKASNLQSGAVTTHWSDHAALREGGYRCEISNRLSERNGNIITSAGAGSTSELVIELLSGFLTAYEMTEVGNHLVLPSIRNCRADQPNSIADVYPCFDSKLSRAIKLMEQGIEEPKSVEEIAECVGISTRQLERIFKPNMGATPAKFYKSLRLKRARTLIEETPLDILEIALATGFSSSNTLSKAFRDEYGKTPYQVRTRKLSPTPGGGN